MGGRRQGRSQKKPSSTRSRAYHKLKWKTKRGRDLSRRPGEWGGEKKTKKCPQGGTEKAFSSMWPVRNCRAKEAKAVPLYGEKAELGQLKKVGGARAKTDVAQLHGAGLIWGGTKPSKGGRGGQRRRPWGAHVRN